MPDQAGRATPCCNSPYWHGCMTGRKATEDRCWDCMGHGCEACDAGREAAGCVCPTGDCEDGCVSAEDGGREASWPDGDCKHTSWPCPCPKASQQVTVEYGIRDEYGTWAVPEYVTRREVDPLRWATRVAEAEGGEVVMRTITITDWKTYE